MLSPDNRTHIEEGSQTGEIEIAQITEPLAKLPRPIDHRSALYERRQHILQQRNTDLLPQLSVASTPAKAAWRQVIYLREENRRLRSELEAQRAELQQLVSEYNAMQAEFDNEVAVIHNGHQQEIEHYQRHLSETMEERNRLQETNLQLERRYQELYHSFQDAVEEEAHKMVTEATQTLELPRQSTGLLQDIVKKLELQIRQDEDKYLLEVMYLKGEVQRMAEQLERERQIISKERHQLCVMQHSISEQAKLREQTLEARWRTRGLVKSASLSIGLLLLLLTFQFFFLAFFHVTLAPTLSLALISPIVVCILLTFVLSRPLEMLKHVYTGAPHKKRGDKRSA